MIRRLLSISSRFSKHCFWLLEEWDRHVTEAFEERTSTFAGRRRLLGGRLASSPPSQSSNESRRGQAQAEVCCNTVM